MAVVTGQTSTRGLAEFQCGQPCDWGGRFGERGSTATRPAAKTTAGHQRLKPAPYATCRSADGTASKAASRIHETDPGPLKAHVQEYVMPDNKFLTLVSGTAVDIRMTMLKVTTSRLTWKVERRKEPTGNYLAHTPS
jgi:hypothetical protein